MQALPRNTAPVAYPEHQNSTSFVPQMTYRSPDVFSLKASHRGCCDHRFQHGLASVRGPQLARFVHVYGQLDLRLAAFGHRLQDCVSR